MERRRGGAWRTNSPLDERNIDPVSRLTKQGKVLCGTCGLSNLELNALAREDLRVTLGKVKVGALGSPGGDSHSLRRRWIDELIREPEPEQRENRGRGIDRKIARRRTFSGPPLAHHAVSWSPLSPSLRIPSVMSFTAGKPKARRR